LVSLVEYDQIIMNTSGSQQFGGVWTEQKLIAVENYLSFYTTALKKTTFKLCYIDAFSGSGNITLKDGRIIDGSAVRALRYDFDRYYFCEESKQYLDRLLRTIYEQFPEKKDRIIPILGDCNRMLTNIADDNEWFSSGWRGVVFLDPYAMNLSWSCLESISRARAFFDVWYLFPFSAVNRNLPKSAIIAPANEARLNNIFGTTNWKEQIYQLSLQQPLFGGPNLKKVSSAAIREYILNRLRETFCTVASNPALLKNTMNSTMFLLCFAASNPNQRASEISLKGANHILKHVFDEEEDDGT